MDGQRCAKRKTRYGVVFLMALLVLGILVGSSACGSSSGADAEIQVDGGILCSHDRDGVRVRSWSTETTLRIDRFGGNGPVSLVVENMPAEHLEIEVWPLSEGGEPARLETGVLSPVQLALTLSGGSGVQEIRLRWEQEYLEEPLDFVVVGDSQGNNDVLAHIIGEIHRTEARFLVHLGDLVPSGREEEYHEFMETMQQLQIPWFSVPGNHDVRGDGLALYEQYLAPRYYTVDMGAWRLLLMDTSLLGMDREQTQWLQGELGGNGKDQLLFMHVPFVDPRGRDHAFLDQEEAAILREWVHTEPSRVKGVFAGHIHMFHNVREDDVQYVTSGGGGAHLYAAPEEGGFHHFTMVSVADRAVSVRAVPVDPPTRSLGVAVVGRQADADFHPVQLQEMAVFEAEGTFENIHGNFRGGGVYRGVPVRDLLEETGGMRPGDRLVVRSWDGYQQEFPYENVYPETAGWEVWQGEMVLAIEYDGIPVPDWDEGYRIVFLPEDGVFDNEDYRRTSLEGEGWYEYPSAGSRWIKTVESLEVVPEQGQSD